MKTTKEIIENIKKVNKTLHTDIDSVPYGQRPALQGSIIRASEKLPKLLEEIENIIFPNLLVGLFADGDKDSIDQVTTVLNKTEGIVLDAEKLYQTIVNLVEPSYGSDRKFCTTQYGLMVQELTAIATDLGYLEIVSPPFIEKVCKTRQDTANHVRECLSVNNVGNQLNVDLLKKEIVDKIVKEEIQSPQIPVMAINVSNHQYTFKPNFYPTIKNIIAIFKGQNPEEETKETKENE